MCIGLNLANAFIRTQVAYPQHRAWEGSDSSPRSGETENHPQMDGENCGSANGSPAGHRCPPRDR